MYFFELPKLFKVFHYFPNLIEILLRYETNNQEYDEAENVNQHNHKNSQLCAQGFV